MSIFAMATLTLLASPQQAGPAIAELAELDVFATPILDRDGEGVLWARGRDWKMSFAPEGSTYHPRLGPEAPGTPLRFRLAAARVGDQALVLEEPAPAVGDTALVEVDHGPVLERWLITSDQVEQQFLLDELPTRDELVVELDLETNLQAVPDGGGWRFIGPDGEVRYGEVTAVDAHGRSVTGEARIEGSRLQLVVPAAFVAEADLPLTIDPVIHTQNLTGNGGDKQDADISYDAALDRYVVTIQEEFTLNEGDVVALVVSYNGTSIQTHHTLGIEVGLEDWREPQVAGLEFGDRFAVVARRASSNWDFIKVRVGNTQGFLGATSTVWGVQTSGSDLRNPDIGGDRKYFGQVSNWMLVWEEIAPSLGRTRIRTMAIDIDGNSSSAVEDLATAYSPDWVGRPSISGRSRSFLHLPHGPLFVAAWERDAPGAGREIGYGHIRSDDATLLFPDLHIGFGSTNVFRPEVSNIDDAPWPTPHTFFAIACEQFGSSTNVSVSIVAPDGVKTRDLTYMEGMDPLDSDLNQYRPVVAVDDDDVAVAYLQLDPTIPGEDADVHFASGGISGGDHLGLSERRQFVGLPAWHDEAPALALEGEGGAATPGRGMIVWTRSSFLQAALVQTPDVDTAGYQYCAPRSNSTGVPGWLYASGRAEFGSTLRLTARDLPGGQWGMFIVSRFPDFIPYVGGSWGHLCLSPAHLGRLNSTIGVVHPSGVLTRFVDTTMLPGPGGFAAAQPGETWYFQGWHRDVMHGNHTTNLTNAVGVEFE